MLMKYKAFIHGNVGKWNSQPLNIHLKNEYIPLYRNTYTFTEKNRYLGLNT